MLTIEFIPYNKIKNITSIARINKLLRTAKDNKIVLLEGRLTKEEETELIRVTMEEIDNEFKGIEMAVIQSDDDGRNSLKDKIKNQLANILLGNRIGFTIIGPATIVKEIKKDPNKIQLLMQDVKRKKRK